MLFALFERILPLGRLRLRIPPYTKRRAVGGILLHERDTRLGATPMRHRPAPKDETVHAPIAQVVPIRELDDRLGMRFHPRDIADEFREPSAREVVNVGREIRLVQLRSASERRDA
jgi:hypothetical protein